MKNQKFGFTLIELLVVIVIIGILATISTATFSGYFKKARDTERQSFVRNAQQILLASQVSADTANYDSVGGSDVVGADTVDPSLAKGIVDELTTQGYAIPNTKNGHNYTYLASGSDFVIAVCQEDDLTKIFEAGTTTGVSWTSCDGTGTTVDETLTTGRTCTTSTTNGANTLTCAASS